MHRLFFILTVLASSVSAASERAQSATELAGSYQVIPNKTYLTADGTDLKLDIYIPRSSGKKTPVPTLIYFHGGGWVAGSKEQSALQVLPYLERGWAAVNVQYRLGGKALAPAAVEDTRCALRWVARHAEEYGFDKSRLVLSGRSAGGHLALITGMLTAQSGFDQRCPEREKTGLERASASQPEVPVAAIINWSGITDVADLIAGPNATTYAVAWLGAQGDASSIAKSVSPMRYVGPDLPAILTLHGDRDRIVPYAHAVNLHEALEESGATNRLHVIRGREHFVDYTTEDLSTAYDTIDAFLAEHL
jgi:acetyl esterase/lipase